MALQEAAEAYLVGLFEGPPTYAPYTPSESPSCLKISNWPEGSGARELKLPKQTKITVLSGPPIPPKGNNLKSYPLNVQACKRKRLPVRNKEIKLFPIGNAMSKQIPLKINGFAETRNSPHLRPV